MEKNIIKQKINKVLKLIKIIRDDLLLIDFDGRIYKISKADYYILKLIKEKKDYDKIKFFLKKNLKMKKILMSF